jgi:hypothetical protein
MLSDMLQNFSVGMAVGFAFGLLAWLLFYAVVTLKHIISSL